MTAGFGSFMATAFTVTAEPVKLRHRSDDNAPVAVDGVELTEACGWLKCGTSAWCFVFFADASADHNGGRKGVGANKQASLTKTFR